jgi:hypothetical protein
MQFSMIFLKEAMLQRTLTVLCLTSSFADAFFYLCIDTPLKFIALDSPMHP